MLLYLAEPIDLATDLNRADIDRLHRALIEPGRYIYRPARAWAVGDVPPDPRVEQVNRAALDRADLLVAVLPDGVRTVGVPMEIERAATHGLPVLVWGGTGSYALAGHRNIETYDHWPYLADRVTEIEKQLTDLEQQLLDPANVTTAPQWLNPPTLTPTPTDRISFVLGAANWPAPTRGYPDDAGWDLYTVGNHTIPPGGYAEIETTVTGLQLPPGCWGMVTGRSSATRRGLMIQLAVIDNGWRGHLAVYAYNGSNETQNIRDGDRIAQLIPTPTIPTTSLVLPPGTPLDPHPRGTRGFGSTGQ